MSRGRFPACCSNLEGVFWVGHTMPQVIVTVLSVVMLTIMIADYDDDGDAMMIMMMMMMRMMRVKGGWRC